MIIEIVLITTLTVLASAFSTIVGFGTTTISMPILLLFFPIHKIIFFLAVIHWFENIWRIILFREKSCTKLIFLFGIPAMIAGYLGARVSIKIPGDTLIRLLGIFLLAYAIFIILKPKAMLKNKAKNSIIGGTFSGFFAGIIGLGGAIRAAFLHSYNLPNISYIFATNAISLLIDTARIPAYMFNGTHLESIFIWSTAFFIPLSLLGTYLTKKLIFKIPQGYFRLTVTIFLGLAGLKFLLYP